MHVAAEPWLPPEPPAPHAGRGPHPHGRPARPQLHTAAELHANVPADRWRPVAYRQGTDGCPLGREFVALRAHLTAAAELKADPLAPDAERAQLWLLLERPCGAPGQDKPKPYLISGPARMSLDELAQLTHRRPAIERESYEHAKQEVGLDQYQGRSWVGLHHQLSMAFLILLRRPPPSEPAPRSQLSPPAAPPEPRAGSPAPQPPTADPRKRCTRLGERIATLRGRVLLYTTLPAKLFNKRLRAGHLPPLPTLGPLP